MLASQKRCYTKKSRNGLKSHINHKHSHCFTAFKTCIEEGSKTQKSGKRHLELDSHNGRANKQSKQLVQNTIPTMLDASAGKLQKHSQATIDNKVTVSLYSIAL